MDWCIGLKITDFYCNGFFGRTYNLAGSTILHAGKDYLVIRTEEGYVTSAWFDNRYSFEDVRSFIEDWTK